MPKTNCECQHFKCLSEEKWTTVITKETQEFFWNFRKDLTSCIFEYNKEDDKHYDTQDK